jgi:hypothetical protein
MAMMNNPWDPYYDTHMAQLPETYDYAIRGEMIVANYSMSEYEYQMRKQELNMDFDTFVKLELTKILCEELAKSKRVEFTKSQDVASGVSHFRARIFATPDSQVRIVRELRKNNT